MLSNNDPLLSCAMDLASEDKLPKNITDCQICTDPKHVISLQVVHNFALFGSFWNNLSTNNFFCFYRVNGEQIPYVPAILYLKFNTFEHFIYFKYYKISIFLV